MKRSLLVAVAVALWPAASVLAQGTAANPAKPDLAKAQTIVNQVCAACHGTDGNSPSPANPNLAGLPAEYITGQLAHFKSGIRANPVMLGMSAGALAGRHGGARRLLRAAEAEGARTPRIPSW